MRYGMNSPIFGDYADVRLLAARAREAEDAGWDGFFVWDHVQWSGEDDGEPRRPAVDPWIALTAIALNTERVRIGPLVTPLPRRRPWKVARETVTLDNLSRGRLILGVGLGFPPGLEYGDFGEETADKVRAEKLDEGLEVLTGLWSSEGEPFRYDGRHYKISNAIMLPRPLQQPRIPVWVAGFWPGSKAPFRRAARWDGVVPILPGETPPEQGPDLVREMLAYIQQHRQSQSPFDLVVTGQTVGDGTEEDTRLVRAYAEAGATWWLEDVSHWRGSPSVVRERIRKGPPHIE
ncbi:MAG: LLM class flavin-dependent oxidoreductase [Chloroflexia bacterium]